MGPPTSTLEDFDWGRACASTTCTYANVGLAVGKARAPANGTVVRWRALLGQVGVGTGPVPVRLQVLRRTVNEPGVAADRFKAIRESAEMQAFDGVGLFETSLPIRKGDYIGLATLSEDTEVFGREEEPGNRWLDFVPTLIPGEPATIPGANGSSAEYILLNATIH
jgi:hypothetical protein